MSRPTKHKRESLVYITKRDHVPLKTAILVRLGAILLALLVCAVVTKVLTGDDPLSLFVKNWWQWFKSRKIIEYRGEVK